MPRALRYDNRELIERLAADYAVGALRGPARRRFERLMASDATIALVAEGWSRRLDALAEGAPRIEPPAAAWARIEAQLGAARPAARTRRRTLGELLFGRPVAGAIPSLANAGLWYCVGFWRTVGIVAAAAAIALFVYVAAVPRFGGIETTHVAVLAGGDAKPALVADLDLKNGELKLKSVAVAAVESGKALELWILPLEGSPRSLGVIAGSDYAVTLAAADLSDLAQGALAVSLEPAGGSPTGLPTGPVLYSGPVLPAS